MTVIPMKAPRQRLSAIVIAAGTATRLRPYSEDRPKGFMELAPGVAIIDLTVRQLEDAGIRKIIVVTRPELQETFERELGSRATIVVAENGFGNLHSVEAGLRATDSDEVVLVMSDHIFEPEILRRLVDRADRSKQITLGLDTMPGYRDIREGLKVETLVPSVIRVGKEIAPQGGVDVGAFLISQEILEAVSELNVEKAKDASISDLMNKLAKDGKVGYVNVTGRLWLDVDTPEDLMRARRLYWEILRRSLMKTADGPVSRFINRPISTRISVFLCRHFRWASPNLFTVISFLIAAGAAFLFTQTQFIAGALLVQLASILDGVDGELARLRDAASPFGGFLDSLLDRIADVLLIIALGFTLPPSPARFVLIGMAVFGVVLVSYVTNILEKHQEVTDLRGKFPWATRDVRLFSITFGTLVSLPLLPLLFCAISPLVFAARALADMFPGKPPRMPEKATRKEPIPVVSATAGRQHAIRKKVEGLLGNTIKVTVALAILQLASSFTGSMGWAASFLLEPLSLDLLFDFVRLLIVVYFGYRIIVNAKFLIDIASDLVLTKLQITRSMYARATTDIFLLLAAGALWFVLSPIIAKTPNIGSLLKLGGDIVTLSFIALVLYDLLKLLNRGFRWIWDETITTLSGKLSKHVRQAVPADNDTERESDTRQDGAQSS